MQKQWYNNFFFAFFFGSSFLCAMVYDNRYMPLIERNVCWHDRGTSQLSVRFVGDSGERAFLRGDDQDHNLPEIMGVFDQNVLSDAMNKLGIPNPLPTAWQGLEILWNTDGKIQMQGLFFEGHHAIYGLLSTGYSFGLMHVRSYNSYFYNRSSLLLSSADKIRLDTFRREMFEAIGVSGGSFGKTACSDIDWYLRLGYDWDYFLKFRRIVVGGRVGVLIPSGPARDQAYAASIPFGGDGHWGIYGALDTLFEVKEDMKAGLLLRLNYRFPREKMLRIPVFTEPQPLGALCGPVVVHPGVTGIIAPYVLLENLHGGLGVMVQYTLRVHQKDRWKVELCNATSDIERLERRTMWSSDIITLDVFYDFGKEKRSKLYDLFVYARWDIPYKLFASERSAKTYQISCGMGCSF